MKPAPFEYHAPRTLDEALALLAQHGPDAKPLAQLAAPTETPEDALVPEREEIVSEEEVANELLAEWKTDTEPVQ